MSTGILLTAVRNHLRTQMSLTDKQCGIEPDGLIPGVAARIYVTIDESQTTNNSTIQIDETTTIEIRVCRQVGRTTFDKRGDMLEKTDLYLAGMQTLDALAQDVKRFLHANQSVRVAANTLLGIPVEGAPFDGTEGFGDRFTTPLFYRSQGKMTVMAGERGDEWVQRPLIFEGARRVQALGIAR